MPRRFEIVLCISALVGCTSKSGDGPAEAFDAAPAETGVDSGPDSSNLDAGVDADAAPGVGVVACGASSCAIPSQVCCPRVDGGTCFPKGAAPCSTPIECDQPGDCSGGTTCCYKFQAACGDVGSSCVKSCGSTDVPACLGLLDCQTCVSLTCAGLPLTTCGTDGVCCH